jgi:hypothetical protein
MNNEETTSTLAEDLGYLLVNGALREPKTFQTVAEALRRGGPCVIRDALPADLAEEAESELRGFSDWRPYEGSAPFYRHHNIYGDGDRPPSLRRCEAIFGSAATKDFIGRLVGKDCQGPLQCSASLYLPLDQSAPHDDATSGRSVAYVWHLTKDWRQKWGGHFYWCSPELAIPPSFNTMIIFPVEPGRSVHFVQTVAPWAMGRRLSINGWWCRSPDREASEPRSKDLSGDASPLLKQVCDKVAVLGRNDDVVIRT